MYRFSYPTAFYSHFCTVTWLAILSGWMCTHGVATLEAASPCWNLVWNDEFEDSSLDATKWDVIDWIKPFNNELQAYHPDQVTVSGGNLIITAIDIPYGGKEYRSGKVESKWAKQYGRWEIRAKLPGTKGTWPAIWLLPDVLRHPWPSQGEIDIMEHRGDKPTLTTSAYHWGLNSHGRKFLSDKQVITRFGRLVDFTDSFHTYAVEWTAQKIRFFVDDIHHFSVHNDSTGGFLASQTAPVEINLNVAVGGDYLGTKQPDKTSVWPQQMSVDYVRVYDHDATPPPAISKNGRIKK